MLRCALGLVLLENVFAADDTCKTGNVNLLRKLDPQCIDNCKASCPTLNTAIDAYLTGGSKKAKEAICDNKADFKCFVDPANVGDCSKLFKKAKNYGFDLPQSTDELDEECKSSLQGAAETQWWPWTHEPNVIQEGPDFGESTLGKHPDDPAVESLAQWPWNREPTVIQEDPDFGESVQDEHPYDPAVELWTTSCAATKRSFFCSGSTRVSCCKTGLVWKECGSVASFRGCLLAAMDVTEENLAQLPAPAEEKVGEVVPEVESSEMWVSSCSAVRRQFFCSGGTRVSCCKRGLLWKECGSVVRFRGCLLAGMDAPVESLAQWPWNREPTVIQEGPDFGESIQDEHPYDPYDPAVELWRTSCAATKRSFFCSGSTRVSCCRRGLLWRECGSVARHHGCLVAAMGAPVENLAESANVGETGIAPNVTNTDQDGLEDLELDPHFQAIATGVNGEVPKTEAMNLLSRLGHDGDAADLMFKSADKDGTDGLNFDEYNTAMEMWITTCRAVRRQWFCSGGTRVGCCRRGLVWARCGGVMRSWRGCR